MADQGDGKIIGIRHVVRLREMLLKWQAMALGAKEDDKKKKNHHPTATDTDGSSVEDPSVLDREDDSLKQDEKNLADDGGESDEEKSGERNLGPPPDVLKGCLAVYVGPEHRRFVIPTLYLGMPVFKVLLEKAEEEFGFDHQGAITFPCETETFKYILNCMERHQKGLIDDEGNPTGTED